MSQKFDQEIEKLVAQKNWSQVSFLCENLEIEAGILDVKLSFYFYGSYLFSYFIQDQLENAKCLWKRIPSSTKKTFSKELGQIWELGKLKMQNEHANLYEALNSQWSPEFQPHTIALVDAHRQKMLVLVSYAYENITLSDFAKYVGLSEDSAKKLGESKGWKFDSSSSTFTPTALTEKKKEKQLSSLEILTKLSDRSLFLELN